MKTLVVDDDFVCRKLLHTILSRHGECDIAVDGKEAVDAFDIASRDGRPYDLICLDIMMPDMDGHEVLRMIRSLEERSGIGGLDGVKVIMTTALSDYGNVRQAFREQCEGYLTKPIDKAKLLELLRSFDLLHADPV
jgi:two-component system, chemotaxis family, chemotaxis protein CheY